MKEPRSHHEDDDWGLCVKDGENWPCPKWKKWTASKDYRIKVLEQDRAHLTKVVGGIEGELRKTREGLRRLTLFTRAGIYHMVRDLAIGAPAGEIEERVDVELQDHTSIGSSHRIVTRGAEDYSVTYTDRNGSVWRNGDLIEERWESG